MPARTGYEHHPDFWHGRLAYAVGAHLNDDTPDEFLRDTYEQYLDYARRCAGRLAATRCSAARYTNRWCRHDL